MPLKILFLTHKFYPDIGGIEVNSEILALEFHKAGHEVRMLTWTSAMGEKQFPFEVIRQPNNATLLQEHRRADVVFENNPTLRLSWPALLFGKPKVVALRTWINRMDGSIAWQDKLKQFWLKRASAVIAVSNAVRKRCWPAAITIGNPYRNTLFKTLPDVTRNKDFVFMGRLVSDKGADLALKALKLLSNNGIVKQLTVIGNGPELSKLEEFVTDANLKEQVVFTGALSGQKLVEQLNLHKYLLVPSVWEEPFGNVALEGMACGCLPIVSDGGGLPDAVGNAGLVVPRGDAIALANSIERLLANHSLEQELRSAATSHLENHHPEKVAARYLNVIEQAVNNR